MATQRFFNADYFNDDYFDDEYFATQSTNDSTGNIDASTALAGPGTVTGAYFEEDYFAARYFAEGYFGAAGGLGNASVFVGSFTPSNVFNGILSATASKASDFDGAVSQVLNFDLDVGFSVNWTFTELTNPGGTIDATTGANPAAFVGLFTENILGSIAATTGANAANFDGTHVAPANRSGVIDSGTALLDSAIVGVNVDPGGNTGSISTSVTKVADFDGQYITSSATGTIGVTLNALNAEWTGNFFDAATNVGPLVTTLGAASASFTGTNVDPEDWIEQPDETDVWTEQAANGTTWTEQA